MGRKKKEMGRAQEDEMLWDADKEGRVTHRHALAGAPPPGQPGYKGIGRAGGGTKKKRDGRAQQDETLWDADKEGKVTLRHSLACAPPLGHRGYKGIGRVGGGEKRLGNRESAARGDA